MSDDEEVLAAAAARAEALGSGDVMALERLLHPRFGWTSHIGEIFDRATYLRSNGPGGTRWRGQTLQEPWVTVVGDTGVLRCIARDEVEVDGGRVIYRMLMTQTWVRGTEGWKCLAGHAGPRLS